MSIGIYCIYWEIDDSKVYIGQSNNILRRYGEHISTLKNNTHRNYKLQNMFNNFGYPVHTIIEECPIAELDIKEQSWIIEYDSFNNGYNLNPGGANHSQGTNNPASVYSEEVLEVAFKLLVSSTNTIKQISECTGVGIGILKCISSGKNHTWLATKFPTEWTYLVSKRRVGVCKVPNASHIGKQVLDTTTGIIYYIDTSIREFATKHKLYESHLAAVIRKDRKSHKGFILYEV